MNLKKLFSQYAYYNCIQRVNFIKKVGENKIKQMYIFKLKTVLLVLQVVPIHPGWHEKHVPFCMWHMLSLQFVGQGMLQLLPYTPDLPQPEEIIKRCKQKYCKQKYFKVMKKCLYHSMIFFFQKWFKVIDRTCFHQIIYTLKWYNNFQS